MAYDKLVDSAQLDADLLSVANAIRAKGGTSAALAFPADFVQAIGDIQTGGGGGSLQSGSFTLAANSTSFTVPLDGAITNFVFYESDFPAGTAGAGWNTVGGTWFNGYEWSFIRYNDNNYNSSYGRPVTVTASSITYTAQYVLIGGKTYYWYGW